MATLNGASVGRSLGSLRFSWGILDQAIISLSNFLMMLLLARALGIRDFGVFSLVVTTLMLITTVQSAVICQPHNVRASRLEGLTYRDFTASTAAAQLSFMVVTSTATAVYGYTAMLNGWSTASLAFALIPTMVAYQLQEFARRILYTEERLRTAAMNDFLGYGGQTFALWFLWLSGSLDSVILSLSTMAAVTGIAAIIGLWSIRQSLVGRVRREIVLENWRFGRWLGSSAVISWSSTQSYAFLAGMVVGPSAVGTIRAAEFVMRPLGVMLSFLDITLPIRFSKLLSTDGPKALYLTVRRLTLLFSIPMLGICVLFAAIGPKTMEILYGQEYAQYRWAPTLFGLYYFSFGLSRIVASALRASEQGRILFLATVAAAIVTASIGWVLVSVAGVYGAIIGILFGSLVVCGVQWGAYLSCQRKPDANNEANPMGACSSMRLGK